MTYHLYLVALALVLSCNSFTCFHPSSVSKSERRSGTGTWLADCQRVVSTLEQWNINMGELASTYSSSGPSRTTNAKITLNVGETALGNWQPLRYQDMRSKAANMALILGPPINSLPHRCRQTIK